jgi:beta-galactosidase
LSAPYALARGGPLVDPGRGPVLRDLRKILQVTADTPGCILTRRAGTLAATPPLLVLVAVEAAQIGDVGPAPAQTPWTPGHRRNQLSTLSNCVLETLTEWSLLTFRLPLLPYSTAPSRRAILCTGLLGGAALAGLTACGAVPARALRRSRVDPDGSNTARAYDFNPKWLFGGLYVDGSAEPRFDDSGFSQVTVPHTVAPLSWREWDHTAWENVWIYRKHFDGAAVGGGRVFADFDGVMVNATAVLNGTTVATHQGGYLPWSAELTGHLVPGDNVLAVVVDSRWLPVPPGGASGGAASIDYLQPGGIYRDVTLRVTPEAFIAGIFAKPVDVLTRGRRVDVEATIDAGAAAGRLGRVSVELLDGARRLAATSTTTVLTPTGATAGSAHGAAAGTTVPLSLTGIEEVSLWSPDTPKLYTVRATLTVAGYERHSAAARIGFREAVFTPGGFYLNGELVEIFGLNRHQLFPYTGMAMSARLQRRDAEILKSDLNCNMVRCSHYPQSPHFLDACDELGLMVWEEPPGWHYVGDTAWQDLVAANVRDMVIRDRNRPSVVVWGTRLNETANYVALYQRTREIADALDGSRQTSGAMDLHSTANWAQDVFAFDDYHSSGGGATLLPPVPGVPYLVTEAVGALDGPPYFRWIDTDAVLAKQAFMHAQVHDIAQADSKCAGLLGWAGFDYASLNGHIWDRVKWPGVADTFRVLKPGAACYESQVDPKLRPVVMPLFCWDFGPGSPVGGPGPGAMIATNCDRLEIYVGGQHVATGTPDHGRFANLAYPPAFVDLTIPGSSGADGNGAPELRIDGYVAGVLASVVRMSADPSGDRLDMTADHAVITADGSDATRITFRAVDAYGHRRPHVTGEVRLALAGPAVLVGDNPFPLGDNGGVGGALVRSLPGEAGTVEVTGLHRVLGRSSVRIAVTPPPPGRRFL